MIKWVKTHKLSSFLLVIILFFALQIFLGGFVSRSTSLRMPTMESDYYSGSIQSGSATPMGGFVSSTRESGIINPGYDQVSDSANRITIQDSTLSLLVKDVRASSDRIMNIAKTLGGFMVNTSYSAPSDSAYATISVRVPTEELDNALNQFRALAVRVTSENLTGIDVTDAYQDLDQRLATLTTTKIRFDEMLSKAITVTEILEVQREIINLEQQIDYIKGQKIAIDDNARLTKITLSLSTDELSLPYASDEKFRPALVFKLAVRSLFSTLQGGVEFLIWAGVFAVIWVPIVGAIIGYKKWTKRSKNKAATAPSITQQKPQ